MKMHLVKTITSDLNQKLEESQKEWIARLQLTVMEERARPRSDDLFGPLDFVADILWRHSGGAVPWAKLTEEQRKEFREKATKTVAHWGMEQIIESKKA